MKKIFSILLLTVAFASCKKEGQNTVETDKKDTLSTAKIVSLNGAITETLAQLGEENNIIGVDVTSNYPEGLKAQNLGHVRSITAESILALQPTVIYASNKDMNPDLLEKLKASKVKLELIDQEFSAQGTANLITTVAKSLNKENYQPIIDNINAKLATVKTLEKKPKVLFIYARGAGNLMVAGKDTPLERIITIAGGENAANDFSDFKPLTPEALVSSNPDVILMFDSGLASIGGVDGLLKIEGISATNAGKNKKVIAMEGQYLSGFGPRLGDAAVDLNKLLQ
ncbi:ABC transporter substrate-binding protein [Myroides ceti]|uniref:ABC transporter substrate-binding protein n=1 Tax=Paenimyroides ceti TaxID=395087 RepID=A0ABT8CW58_9FLAO|nr:ABC transporter substrate-binding protein [Paenimyroides ceti]MDN3708769.1 ABC transporter substrate-binding protein [Paenimyroides ceti]MDN3709344.1 ABC transporter substrate-binding protein [Paenimyroides ceti]